MRYKSAIQLCLPLEYPRAAVDPELEKVRRDLRLEGFARPQLYVPMRGADGAPIEFIKYSRKKR
jgi:hypothetical protein